MRIKVKGKSKIIEDVPEEGWYAKYKRENRAKRLGEPKTVENGDFKCACGDSFNGIEEFVKHYNIYKSDGRKHYLTKK
jgi:hypothetical protein